MQKFPIYSLPHTLSICLSHYQYLPPAGTFVKTDEPILTSHYHSNSTVCIVVHSWCCTYGFGQMYNDIYPALHIIQSIFTALKILCAPPIHPSTQPLATTDPFTDSIVLSFPECHRVGIPQCVAFSD